MPGEGQLFLHGKNSDTHSARALACNCGSLRPRPSGYTARELPSKGREEKTSNCTKGKRRRSLLIAAYCTASRHAFNSRACRPKTASGMGQLVVGYFHFETAGETEPRGCD